MNFLLPRIMSRPPFGQWVELVQQFASTLSRREGGRVRVSMDPLPREAVHWTVEDKVRESADLGPVEKLGV